MYESMSILGNSHVSSALSHTRLVSVDFARIIRHYNQDESPLNTITVVESIRSYDMKVLVEETANICLGNDIRQQGQCATIRLACYPS